MNFQNASHNMQTLWVSNYDDIITEWWYDIKNLYTVKFYTMIAYNC